MKTIMFSLLWILSVVTMFIVHVRPDTQIRQKDLSPRRCHHCNHNLTACDLPGSLVVCPAGQPFCATVATAPNFTSTLTCAVASELPCSLTFNSKLALEMTCICDGHLCNAPYSALLQNELVNFSTKIPTNTTDLTAAFLKASVFKNFTLLELYKILTNASKLKEKSLDLAIGKILIGSSGDAPRAEALKHKATVPPDDDEDEGEGSGTFEENKSQAAPAAPSSFLPSEENNAPVLYSKIFLLMISSLFSLTIV